MRAIVTGATGVVGRYLVRELVENTPGVEQVVALSRRNRYKYEDHPDRNNAILLDCWGDLRYSPIRLITQFSPSHVFHCAGEGRQNAPARELWSANVDTTLNLLEACKSLKEKIRFIYTSSIVCEDGPTNLYSASKIAGETLVRSYDKIHENIKGVTIRFPAVAGAGNNHGVVKAVVEKLLDKSTNILSLYTNSQKPFVYAGQLSNRIVEIAKFPWGADWNLCPSDNITVQGICNIAMFRAGIVKEIQWSNNSWIGDKQEVKPTYSNYYMMNSDAAIDKAISDILKEDHGIN